MDRLTTHGPKFGVPISFDVCANVACSGMCADCKIHELIARLCAYEDTGIEPEKIAEFASVDRWNDAVENELYKYMEAEKEGRLILLPCKVTDTVYMIESCLGGENCVGKRKKKFPLTDRVVSARIDHVTIGGTTGKPVFDLCTETGGWFMSLEPGEFFLTREEAEKALEEGRKNSEAD